MMSRIRQPLFTRNPYILTDDYVGLHLRRSTAWPASALVGLVIAHVYFAVRPEKWWITKSMIFGWVTRGSYLEHHDPARWKVGGGRAGRM